MPIDLNFSQFIKQFMYIRCNFGHAYLVGDGIPLAEIIKSA